MTNPRPLMNGRERVAALVLGAAVWPGGEPSPTLRRRALEGARLYHAGKADLLIACGGTGHNPPSEAEVIRRVCLEAGLPANAILLEDRSTRTRENIAFALPLLKRAGATQVVIVTDRYHAPRARLIGRKHGLTCSTSSPPPSGTPWHRRLRSRLREVPAFLWELLRPVRWR